MKKEYVGITIVALFILSYVLDYLAGPVVIPVNNPFLFLKEPYISMYPFTAVSIIIKTIVAFLTVTLILSFIQGKYFTKAAIVLFVASLFELYSIQQMATGQRLIPVEWILSFAYSGLTLIIMVAVYILIGIISPFAKKKKIPQGSQTQYSNHEPTSFS